MVHGVEPSFPPIPARLIIDRYERMVRWEGACCSFAVDQECPGPAIHHVLFQLQCGEGWSLVSKVWRSEARGEGAGRGRW